MVTSDVKPVKKQGFLSQAWGWISHTKAGIVGFALVGAIFAFSYIVPLFFDTHSPLDGSMIWQPPSTENWLGTNGSGQDSFKVLVAGGAEPLTVGLTAAGVGTVIAIILGSLAGYFRGRLDSIVLNLTDMFICIPGIIVMLILVATFGVLSPMMIGFIIGATSWPFLTRAIRAQVMSLKEREFVEAARLQRLGSVRIIFIEILPNMAGFLVISFIMAINFAIYGLIGAYLIGLLPRGGQNWGLMISEAWTSNSYLRPGGLAYILAPLLMITLLSIGLITMQRSIEQAVNPRLRER